MHSNKPVSLFVLYFFLSLRRIRYQQIRNRLPLPTLTAKLRFTILQAPSQSQSHPPSRLAATVPTTLLTVRPIEIEKLQIR